MKFNSQICTSREQSERLLALGLKKETADMHWYKPVEFEHDYWFMGIGPEWCGVRDIPAWSLHRLIEMMPDYIVVDSSSGLNPNFYLNIRNGIVSYKDNRGFSYVTTAGNMYDAITRMIAFLIKEGYLNNKYLCEK